MLYQVVIFLLIVYAAGLLHAAVNPPRLRGLGLLIAGFLIGTISYSTGQNLGSGGAYGGGAFLLIIILAVALPLGLAGLGALQGGFIARLRPRPAIWRLTIALALLWPVALTAWFDITRRADISERQTRHEALMDGFATQTVTITMSEHTLHLPAAPSLQLRHACQQPQRSFVTECTTSFSRNPGLRYPVGAAPDVSEIHLSTEGVNAERLHNWCALRTDLQKSVWCATPPSGKLRFSTEPALQPQRYDYGNWTAVETADPALRLHCQVAWDGTNCQANFELAPGIHARIWYDDPDMTRFQETASAGRDHATRLWQAMQADR